MLTLSALYIYPIKSAGGIPLQSSEVGPRGLRHDRRWMVVDPAGRLVTQREFPKMRLIRVRLGSSGLEVEAPVMPPLEVPYQPQGEPRHAEVWGDAMSGVSVSAEAKRWFSLYLSEGCDLLYMPDEVERWQGGKPYRSLLSFADGNPFHLITEASVAYLNAQLRRPVTAETFRPNLVIGGGEAYSEDFWRRIQVAELRLAVVESCARCCVVNVTPEGRMTAEPLRTLARTRSRGKAVLFGQHLVQDAPPAERFGYLKVGDMVEVLEVGSTANPVY